MADPQSEKKRVVLLVEADEGTAELERRTLSRPGLSVRTVTRVADAVALLEQESFCAVVLDYNQPDGDPWRVVDAAKARVPRIPVIIITAKGSERVAAEAIRHGVAEYVEKADIDQLPDAVNRVARLAEVEDRLSRTNALFQLIANNTSDIIATAGSDATITYISPACGKLFGYEPEELIGTSVLDYVHAEDWPSMKRLFADLPKQEHSTQAYRRRRKDGTYIWVEATVNALRDPETKQVTEVVSIVRDVSERKQVEENVRSSLHEKELPDDQCSPLSIILSLADT